MLSRQTGDMDAIRHFIAFVIYQVYENVFLFFFALVMIFTVSWKLALCMCVVLPFALLVTLSQTKTGVPASRKYASSSRPSTPLCRRMSAETASSKAFSKEEYEIGKFNKKK